MICETKHIDLSLFIVKNIWNFVIYVFEVVHFNLDSYYLCNFNICMWQSSESVLGLWSWSTVLMIFRFIFIFILVILYLWSLYISLIVTCTWQHTESSFFPVIMDYQLQLYTWLFSPSVIFAFVRLQTVCLAAVM